MTNRKGSFLKTLAAGAAVLAVHAGADAATLAQYTFPTANNPSASQRVQSSDTDPLTSAGGFAGSSALGARATVASAADYVVFADATGSSFDSSHYVGFTLDIDPGREVDLTSLAFSQAAGIGSKSNSDSSTVYSDVRSSLDNFQSSLLTTSVTKGTGSGGESKNPAPSIDLSAYTGVTGSVEFRFFVYDSTDDANDVQRFDNIVLSGTVVPEPASIATAGLLGIGLLASRRRRTTLA